MFTQMFLFSILFSLENFYIVSLSSYIGFQHEFIYYDLKTGTIIAVGFFFILTKKQKQNDATFDLYPPRAPSFLNIGARARRLPGESSQVEICPFCLAGLKANKKQVSSFYISAVNFPEFVSNSASSSVYSWPVFRSLNKEKGCLLSIAKTDASLKYSPCWIVGALDN